MIGPLVKEMKLSDKILQRIVHTIFREMKSQNVVTFKAKEEQVAIRAVEILKKELAREQELNREVDKILDEMERTNPGEVQRYKMFPMVKRRLAKERGVIL
jgi:hypothetical protein